MDRIRRRSFQRFGSRMLPGGDLYESEQAFFRMADGRADPYSEPWMRAWSCPVIRVDGTKPICDNVRILAERIQREPGVRG